MRCCGFGRTTDPKVSFDLCCSPDAAYDARRIADKVDVPFYLLDAREQFDEVVISPFVPTYEAGQDAPNPCVWCNREIKFGTFLHKARRLGCEYVATGHYVKRVDGPDGVELHRGADDTKRPDLLFVGAGPRRFAAPAFSAR